MFSGRNFFVSSAFRAPAKCLASPERTGKRSNRAFAFVDLLGSRRCSVCIVITTTMKARDASEGKNNTSNKLMAANSIYDGPNAPFPSNACGAREW